MRARGWFVIVLVVVGGAACGGGGDDGKADAGGIPTPLTAALHEGAPLAPPSELVAGLPADVVDASHDEVGNLWVAAPRALHLRRAGQAGIQSFGVADGLKDAELLSVSGGTGGHAWVGYRGQGDDDLDPPAMRESGGAGEIALVGAGLDVRNFLLVTPPGDPAHPQGRNKVRSCWRAFAVKTGPRAGDAWFGCNHGVAMWSATSGAHEHHHPAVCETDPGTGACTLHAGDVPAVAFAPDGDAWFGGTYGVMQLDYMGPNGADFNAAALQENLRIWANPLSPNRFGSVDVTALAVAFDGTLWVSSFQNGLAHRLNDGALRLFQKEDGLPTNALVDLALDGQNRLWVATAEEGVFVIDLATLEWHRAPGLPSANARRVVVERVGGTQVVTVTVDGAVAVYR